MNILLMVLAYFLYTMFKPDKNADFLSGINLEKLMPLVSLFNGGGDLGALLNSDLLKDFNFMGMDMSKILPVIELLKGFGGKKETENAAPPPGEQNSETQSHANVRAAEFPLAPISDIADKNITYSLTRYLSGE